ncbi:5-formyltetrahydrofolate cyclo-ligase [bacterium]|nr:5-formyltetrahydrofolate cyclo-ligase [bacterium]
MKTDKNNLRDKFRKLRNSLLVKDKKEKSRRIAQRVFSLQEFKKARVIMFYFSFEGEVGTEEMIDTALNMGKRVVLPAVIDRQGKMEVFEVKKDYKKQLTKGAFGIMGIKKSLMKKFNKNNIEMVIVPGIVFDRKGQRIGFGYGYYDRFLNKLKKEVCRAGLAYELQVINEIPLKKKYDVDMNLIITEDRVIKVKKAA